MSAAGAGRPGAADRQIAPEDERSADDRDEGWGDAPGGLDDEWYLSQRPPHWD
ncbi:hypothetical protein [Kineococcus sp. SYSU DK018]|uniref:hypothetical protein n=1 Tax=Kineococcus sp. SYSU DK018 TaxID=3383139 RepID=UPI003D7F0AC9